MNHQPVWSGNEAVFQTVGDFIPFQLLLELAGQGTCGPVLVGRLDSLGFRRRPADGGLRDAGEVEWKVQLIGMAALRPLRTIRRYEVLTESGRWIEKKSTPASARERGRQTY